MPETPFFLRVRGVSLAVGAATTGGSGVGGLVGRAALASASSSSSSKASSKASSFSSGTLYRVAFRLDSGLWSTGTAKVNASDAPSDRAQKVTFGDDVC